MFTILKRMFNAPKIGCAGAMISPKDDRDFIYKKPEEKIAGAENVPTSFTLANKIGKILNQGQTNSCTGFAATYFMNVLVNKTMNTTKDYNINPFFNYYWGRDFSGTLINGDSGAYIRSTLQARSKKGIWCCNMSTTTQKPPEDYDENIAFKLKGYQSIDMTDRLENMKYILSIEQLPIMSCVRIIYNNVDTWTGEMKGDDSSPASGWHAMTIVGYETRKDGIWFHTANSWGTVQFGDKGFAWIHEDYFKNPNLVAELWCPYLLKNFKS